MPTGQRRILVLYWHPDSADMRVAIRRHLHVLDSSDRQHQILYYNALNGAPAWLRHFKFDVVILHTTFLCLRWSHLFYLWKWKMRWLNDLDCVKIAIPQDEYDHSEILDEWLFELGVRIIFTNFDEGHRRLLYPIMWDRITFYQCLTGYIDGEDVRRCQERLRGLEDRPYDIVYRGTHLPYWFGSHGQVKHQVAEVTSRSAIGRGLKCDISTEVDDAILGSRWFDFLGSGRTVIGCESGSSVLDRRGEIKARIQKFCAAKLDLSFEEVSERMPAGWNDHNFFAISPRHFEAVITKTCQVLVKGHYDGVLQPVQHYIPLEPDFSNLDEVLEKVRDKELLRETTERAYHDICLSGRYTYIKFAEDIEVAFNKEITKKRKPIGRYREVLGQVMWALGSAAARVSEQERLIRCKAAEKFGHSRGLLRFIRHPLVGLGKGFIAVTLILTSPTVRRILAQYFHHKQLRTKVSLDRVLVDLLMLRLLQQAKAGVVLDMLGVPFDVGYLAKPGTLVFQSRRLAVKTNNGKDGMERGEFQACIEKEKPLRRIVWDHSAMGSQILYPVIRSRRVTFSLTPSGVYEFQALMLFAKFCPKETWQALVPRS